MSDNVELRRIIKATVSALDTDLGRSMQLRETAKSPEQRAHHEGAMAAIRRVQQAMAQAMIMEQVEKAARMVHP